jgi:hypothetical protein
MIPSVRNYSKNKSHFCLLEFVLDYYHFREYLNEENINKLCFKMKNSKRVEMDITYDSAQRFTLKNQQMIYPEK